MSNSEYQRLYEIFRADCADNTRQAGFDKALQQKTNDWLLHTCRYKYSYNFTWLGRPIIQYPQDIVAMQELIWQAYD